MSYNDSRSYYGLGMLQLVDYVHDNIDYIDPDRIGITGHSTGGRNVAFTLDAYGRNEHGLEYVGQPDDASDYETKVSSALILAFFPDHYLLNNMPSGVNVGINFARYDEGATVQVTKVDGYQWPDMTVSPEAKFFINTTSPDTFTLTAESAINPDNGHNDVTLSGWDNNEKVEIGKYYGSIDEGTLRVVYNPNTSHQWQFFSATNASITNQFFMDTLGAPNPIDGSNQIWQFKAAFNAIGLVGFMMFAVSLAIVLLDARPFTALKASGPVQPAPALTGRSKGWFWASNLLAVAFSFLVYMFGYSILSGAVPSFFPQSPVYFIGMWSLLCGLFALLLIFIGGKVTGAKVDGKATGMRISGKTLGLTVLLALIVAAATYGLVFLADYFFKTDFRLWVLALKAFTADKFPIILIYLPFFLVYYICNSISINCCNYFQMGRHEWVNTAVMAVFNGLACLIMILVMYICFFVTGYLPSEFIPGFGGSIIGIWLYPIVVILPVAAVVSRILYKHTRNPYLSGIIMALLVTTMSCTNTLTQL